MAKINLLPWREELRQQRQKEFVGIIAVVLMGAAALVWTVGSAVDSGISNQKKRNSFIQREMAVLDEKIAEIEELRARKEQLLERMELIQNLQGNRPIIVRLFDELARAVPDDLYFTDLEIQGNLATVKGRARSNNRVAALMRNFDESDWFMSPNLISVKSKDDEYNAFEVTMIQTDPKAGDKEEGADER